MANSAGPLSARFCTICLGAIPPIAGTDQSAVPVIGVACVPIVTCACADTPSIVADSVNEPAATAVSSGDASVVIVASDGLLTIQVASRRWTPLLSTTTKSRVSPIAIVTTDGVTRRECGAGGVGAYSSATR